MLRPTPGDLRGAEKQHWNNRSTALEWSVLKYWGGGGLNRFDGYPTSPAASVMAQNIHLFGPHEGFLTHKWVIKGNKQITDKHSDETEMRTQQKRVATDTWRSLRCRATHWNTRANENQHLNIGGPSNRQKKLRPQPTKINSFMSGPSLSLTPDPPACN